MFKIVVPTLAVSALAIGAAVTTGLIDHEPAQFATAAYAADNDSNAGNAQGAQNQGGQGAGGQGAQSGQDNQGGSGAGQGGPDPDSDSKGPNAGGPADTSDGGGKPIWAQEGIPEIELGRLSVARSPDQVLTRALDEAIATQTDPMTDFYNLPLDQMLVELSLNWDNVTIYDSPLQNLALFKDVLADGDSQLAGVSDGSAADQEKLLAVFLGVASDKTLTVSEGTVTAILTILGDGLDNPIAVDVASLATAAEAVRLAVYTGHEG
jgi:hypothetical protein